ncbi:MAG: ZIP family metal transporter [Hyphomicrobiales bacterium]|nr:ZIP family metal transporter [Hyphomicrobiales bacterium]
MGAAASLAAGLATAIGALPVLLVRNVSQALHDTLLGFAAGVMLAASFFSLLIPGLHLAQSDLGSRPLAAGVIALSMLLGAAALAWTNRAVPHEHFLLGRAGPASLALRRTWLFVLAITLHNVPEGLAVGIGFGSGDAARAATLAFGIGLQNIPEGLAVAVALAALKYRPLFAFAVGGATGLVEPVAGLLGAALVTVFAPLLPWGLGFAAGAMIFVISNEIVPETHRHGHEGMATVGLMLGIALMMFLDVVFS